MTEDINKDANTYDPKVTQSISRHDNNKNLLFKEKIITKCNTKYYKLNPMI